MKILLVLLLSVSFLFAAPKTLKIGLVTDVGKINDKTFNQYAYEGMQKAVKKYSKKGLKIKTSYIETAQPTDYDKNIALFAEEGYDMIVTVGFMLGDATKKAALKYKKVKFAIVDFAYSPKLNNVLGLMFSEDQAGFLAGALAALMSKSGVIGFVGGKEIPPVIKYRKGYEAGAKYVNKKIKVLGVYIDSFTDPARGKAAALSQISEKADVLFGAGGPTGSGALKAAVDKGVYGIGVDQDEYYTTFGGKKTPKLITSAMKRVDNAVVGAISLLVKSKFKGGTYIGTIRNNGIGLAPFHDAKVPKGVIKKLNAIKKKLKKGKIKTNVKL